MIDINGMTFLQLFDELRKIGLEKLNHKENGFLITAVMWLKTAFDFISKLGLFREYIEEISKDIDEFNNYCEGIDNVSRK